MDKQDIIIENQVALFNLLGSLVRKITGQTPTVELQTGKGTIVLYPSIELVKYQDEAVLSDVEH